MEAREALNIAVLSGEILLTSGSETYRVEDTIHRICSAYGIKCEAFVTPTGIFASAWPIDESEPVTLIKRIKSRTINLNNIEIINTFSRNLQNEVLPYDEAMKILKSIETVPYFPFMIRLGAAAITSFAYALLFNGKFVDGIFSSAISMLIYSLLEKMKKVDLSEYFRNFICSFIAGLLSIWASRYLNFLNTSSIIVGTIMILVPGLAITNGIRDALHGDIMSSQSRLSEALLIAVSIGVGVGSALSLMKYWM